MSDVRFSAQTKKLLAFSPVPVILYKISYNSLSYAFKKKLKKAIILQNFI